MQSLAFVEARLAVDIIQAALMEEQYEAGIFQQPQVSSYATVYGK